MYEEMFSKNFPQVENFIEPAIKANKLAVDNFEKLVNFQMDAFQSYVDLGIEQMKAAAEINGPQAFQTYFSKQIETGNVLRQKILDDTKALVDLGNGFKEDFAKLAEANAKEFAKAAPKTVKKAA